MRIFVPDESRTYTLYTEAPSSFRSIALSEDAEDEAERERKQEKKIHFHNWLIIMESKKETQFVALLLTIFFSA